MNDKVELTRKSLLPKINPNIEEDAVPPAEIIRSGKEAGFNLSGSTREKPIKKKSRPPRENRTNVINIRIRPSIGEALREYTYDEDVSMADIIEEMIQRYIIDRKPL